MVVRAMQAGIAERRRLNGIMPRFTAEVKRNGTEVEVKAIVMRGATDV